MKTETSKMELEIPSAEEPVATRRNVPLAISDVDHLFVYHKCNKTVPFRPKGGEVYVFRPDDPAEINDWVSDGHMFSCEGTRKIKGRIGAMTKKYFYLLIKTEGKKRITDKRFRKEIFTSQEDAHKGTVVIHYIGDETLSVPRPHGNSLRQTRISIRPKPSVSTKIEESVKGNSDKSAHKIYKEAVTEGHSVTDKPRNIRQVHYIREKARTEERPTKDAITNLQAMAYEDEGFIHYIATYPDLVCIAGLEEMLVHLNAILQIVPKVEQLLSYDTTFSMGDFYVSALLFKYGILEESPVVPALFLIHERKFQSHHQHLFEILRRYCKTNLKNVALATDMEMGILNAAEAETTLKVVGCWRHLKKDIERYIHENEGKRQDALEFIDNVYEILRAKSQNDIEKLTHDMKTTWNPQLKHYFEKQIEPKIEKFASPYVSKYTKFDKFSGVTTNQSEGFNWLMKDLTNWREGPIDCVVLAFRFLQQYYLCEIKRGLAGVGNFTLREEYMKHKIAIDEINRTESAVCSYRDIVSLIRDGKFLREDSNGVPSATSKLSNTAKAIEIKNSERIVFVPRFGCFVACSHVLAVKTALRMTDSPKQFDTLPCFHGTLFAISRIYYRLYTEFHGFTELFTDSRKCHAVTELSWISE